MKYFFIALLAAFILVNPAMAKRGKTLGCVPSPNPDVAPCDLDQTPIMPSEVAKAKKAAAGVGAKPTTKSGISSRGRNSSAGKKHSGASSVDCVPSPDPTAPPCDWDAPSRKGKAAKKQEGDE